MPSLKANRVAKRDVVTRPAPPARDVRSLRRDRATRRDARADLTSLKPPILTKAELARGQDLQSNYEVLNGRFMSLTHDALVDAWRAAAETYRDNPTDETFAAMKQAAFNKSFFCAETRPRSQCKFAVGAFLAREMVPWALGIVDRNISAAADAFKKVRAVENRRCIKLTGQPLNHSDIVTAAERPVRHLESIRVRLDKPTSLLLPSPESVLKMFARVGSERFEDLIAPEFSPEEIAIAVEDEEKARAEDLDVPGVLDEGEFPTQSESTDIAPTL